jgi:NADH:ubiquinone oxidoreductase subunit 6 (subunit J)
MFIIFINVILEAWWIIKGTEKVLYIWKPLDWSLNKFTHINLLGLNLYSEYAFPLLILSLLLLVAMVGAIVLTLELGVITRKQILTDQHQRNNSWI